MNDETAAGQPEGDALPECTVQTVDYADAGLHSVLAAIERWYAAHFHAAAVAGRTPISAEEKASLIQHVAEAFTPKE